VDRKPRRVVSVSLAIACLLTGCEQEPGQPSMADQALAELQAKYEELKEQQQTDPVEWAKGDLENMGDWEYRVLELPPGSAADTQDQLNALGNERWEAFWVRESAAGMQVYLKRPAVSYISRVPFSQLGRFIDGGEGAE
jgi:hypothetical protein